MADKTPEEKASELASKVLVAKAQFRSGTGLGQKTVILGIAGILCATVLGYIWWPKPDPRTLQSSESTSFTNQEGDPFGNLQRPPPVKALDPNPDLLEKIKSLESEIAALKERPGRPIKDEVEINRLTVALDELKSRMSETEQQYQNALRDRDIDIERLRNELDIKRATNDENSAHGYDGRKAAENQLQKRVSSPLNPLGSGTKVSDSQSGQEKSELEKTQLSQNLLFARDQAKPVPVEQAKLVANPAHTVLQGTVLQGTLETAINTDMPGAIRAVISEDVHSLDGRRILIPRGAKVLGKYSDHLELGQKRVMVIWERILLPDNQTVTINAYGGDAIGRAGIAGNVDTHFFNRFGSAALISIIGLAPTVATTAITSKTDDNRNHLNAVNLMAGALSQNLQSSLGGVIGDYLRRPPTIGVQQGASITIYVDRDLEIF